MLVVCPDGVVVAYAWKRQLDGQAGARERNLLLNIKMTKNRMLMSRYCSSLRFGGRNGEIDA
jgi:hypothetical protein